MIGAVMPTYNQAHFIEEAIESLVGQVDALVVVDDASTDDTAKLLEARQDLVALRHLENHGTAEAINTGIRWLMEHTGHEWLTWASSDNVYLPSWREVVTSSLSGAVGAAYTAYLRWDGRGAGRHYFIPHGPQRLLGNCNCYYGPSFLIRRSVWQDHRGAHSHDYDNWLRVEEACWDAGLQIVGINEAVCMYRIHPGRRTQNQGPGDYDAPFWQREARLRRGQI